MARSVPTVIVGFTGVLLTGYFGVVVWGWASPTTDPQHGMAEGFLAMVTAGLLGLAAIFWIGIRTRRPGLVWFVFAICALPSLSLVARGIYLLVRWIGGG